MHTKNMFYSSTGPKGQLLRLQQQVFYQWYKQDQETDNDKKAYYSQQSCFIVT